MQMIQTGAEKENSERGGRKKIWRERNIAPQHTTHEHPRGDCRIPLERWFASKYFLQKPERKGGGIHSCI